MPLIFSYGTLQQERVQLATFGRLLKGQKDALPQAETTLIEITDPDVVAESGETHYQNISFNGRPDSSVTGTVFEITDAELADADRYEARASYTRMAVELASGTRAWVYVDARTAPVDL